MVLEDLKDGFKNPKIKSLARLRFAVRMFFWISLTVSPTLYFLGHFVVLDFYIFCLCFSVMDHPFNFNGGEACLSYSVPCQPIKSFRDLRTFLML